jgi:hypothetical protein
VRSFITVKDRRMKEYVDDVLAGGTLWPEPLIQLNPAFEPGESFQDLVSDNALHAECERIFRIKSAADSIGVPMQLHRHQTEAIRTAASGRNYVLTTGTGSGKSKLRCELDAAFFHLYGLAREDVEHVMSTFPIVERRDVSAHGELRTELAVLNEHEALSCARELRN